MAQHNIICIAYLQLVHRYTNTTQSVKAKPLETINNIIYHKKILKSLKFKNANNHSIINIYLDRIVFY